MRRDGESRASGRRDLPRCLESFGVGHSFYPLLMSMSEAFSISFILQ